MPADSHRCPPPSAPSPPDAGHPPVSRPIDSDLIARLLHELQLKDRELDDLRGRLRDIHTSDAWSMIRTVSQVRQALAPHGTRRDRAMKQGVRGLRRLKKGVAAVAQSARRLSTSTRRVGTREIRIDSAVAGTYTVICLPMIEWEFRFQRPQQIMRQFARGGHPVLYAVNRFHRGQDVRMRLIETNVIEIGLPGDPAANVYQMLPTDSDVLSMLEAFERLGADMNLSDAVVVAQLPYWFALAQSLRDRYGWPIVYDCMDDHSGFVHNSQEVLRSEERLIAGSDLVVVSSERLLAGVRDRARTSMLLRNACEYDHFAGVTHTTTEGRETTRVGYYGAIAEWFDSRLVAELAGLRPDWSFELIGSTLAGDVRRLEGLTNVRLHGERPYGDLPRWIGDWDAFIIPFKRAPLTEATNPVKVYEMLATGKPVVAVGLPELVPIAEQGLIRLGDTAEEFAGAIESELRNANPGSAERRRTFARANTWNARYVELAAAIDGILRRGDPDVAQAGTASGVVGSRA